jgi:hypothetical protein
MVIIMKFRTKHTLIRLIFITSLPILFIAGYNVYFSIIRTQALTTSLKIKNP